MENKIENRIVPSGRLREDGEYITFEEDIPWIIEQVEEFLERSSSFFGKCEYDGSWGLPSRDGYNAFLREMLGYYADAKDLSTYYKLDLNKLFPASKYLFQEIEATFDVKLCSMHGNEIPCTCPDDENYYRGNKNLYEDLVKEHESWVLRTEKIKKNKKKPAKEKKVIKYKRKKSSQ